MTSTALYYKSVTSVVAEQFHIYKSSSKLSTLISAISHYTVQVLPLRRHALLRHGMDLSLYRAKQIRKCVRVKSQLRNGIASWRIALSNLESIVSLGAGPMAWWRSSFRPLTQIKLQRGRPRRPSSDWTRGAVGYAMFEMG